MRIHCSWWQFGGGKAPIDPYRFIARCYSNESDDSWPREALGQRFHGEGAMLLYFLMKQSLINRESEGEAQGTTARENPKLRAAQVDNNGRTHNRIDHGGRRAKKGRKEGEPKRDFDWP